jgi:hypothetical protein
MRRWTGAWPRRRADTGGAGAVDGAGVVDEGRPAGSVGATRRQVVGDPSTRSVGLQREGAGVRSCGGQRMGAGVGPHGGSRMGASVDPRRCVQVRTVSVAPTRKVSVARATMTSVAGRGQRSTGTWAGGRARTTSRRT